MSYVATIRFVLQNMCLHTHSFFILKSKHHKHETKETEFRSIFLLYSINVMQ